MLILRKINKIIDINDSIDRRQKFETEQVDTDNIQFMAFEEIIEFIGKVKMD